MFPVPRVTKSITATGIQSIKNRSDCCQLTQCRYYCCRCSRSRSCSCRCSRNQRCRRLRFPDRYLRCPCYHRRSFHCHRCQSRRSHCRGVGTAGELMFGPFPIPPMLACQSSQKPKLYLSPELPPTFALPMLPIPTLKLDDSRCQRSVSATQVEVADVAATRLKLEIWPWRTLCVSAAKVGVTEVSYPGCNRRYYHCRREVADIADTQIGVWQRRLPRHNR